MARTDIHAPSQFDPADYQVVDYLDNKRPEPPHPNSGAYSNPAYMEAYNRMVAAWQERIFRYFPDWKTGGDDHQSISQCNHCGHPGIRWVAVVEHVPTGKFLAFGEICADRCELPGRDSFRARYVKTHAQKEQARLENLRIRAEWENQNQDVAQFLSELNDDYDSREPEFLLSLKHQLANKGELSERQVEAARKFIAKRQEQTERRQAEVAKIEGPLVEGRRQIEGEILSTKLQHGNYGTTLKMLVREDDGNKVWGSVPQHLEDLTLHVDTTDEDGNWITIPAKVETLKGQRVRFTAQVERSRDDENFGFFKRPTGAELVGLEVTS